MILVNYEWKLRVYKSYKVFGHSCKTLIEIIKLHVNDMLKIMNRNDYLMACNSQINIIVVASTLPRTVIIPKTVALDTITL
jgi:hypothetical protein